MAASSSSVDSDASVRKPGVDPVSYVASGVGGGMAQSGASPPPIRLDPLVVWRNVRILFATKTLARITIVMWITYIFDCEHRLFARLELISQTSRSTSAAATFL